MAANQESQALPSTVFEMPDDLAVAGQALARAEAAFFVAHGFLLKKGLLSGADVDAAMARIWWHVGDRVPMRGDARCRLVRDDPAAWLDPRWARMPPTPKAGPHAGRHRVVHAGATLKLHYLGGAPFLRDLVPNNPRVRRVAAALLGDLKASERARGVYALFPTTRRAGAAATAAPALGPHTDQVCQQLNVCAYLDDVPPRNGGFTVYPGSHALVFRAHRWAANFSPLPKFRAVLRQVVDEIRPVELVGGKGDVIFWHGRAVHSAGLHTGDRIRWAVFADFTHGRETLDVDEHKALGQFEWFKDAQLFRHDHAADGDMWRGWALGGWPAPTWRVGRLASRLAG